MSIADSVLSMRVPAPFQPLSGRYSKQSSLSIQSNNPLGPSPGPGLTIGDKSIRASPVLSQMPRGTTPVPGLMKPSAVAQQQEAATKLLRQESSFTQEEIYR